MKIHICLISAQNIPNIIPLFIKEIRPEKVICLISEDMSSKFINFHNVLKRYKFNCKFDISDTSNEIIKNLKKFMGIV
jgi:hypothetical protein